MSLTTDQLLFIPGAPLILAFRPVVTSLLLEHSNASKLLLVRLRQAGGDRGWRTGCQSCSSFKGTAPLQYANGSTLATKILTASQVAMKLSLCSTEMVYTV